MDCGAAAEDTKVITSGTLIIGEGGEEPYILKESRIGAIKRSSMDV